VLVVRWFGCVTGGCWCPRATSVSAAISVSTAKLPSFSASAVSGNATVAASVGMVGATNTLPSSVTESTAPDPAFPPLLAFLALLPSLATPLLFNCLSVGIFLITSYKKIINKKRGYKNAVTTTFVKQYKQYKLFYRKKRGNAQARVLLLNTTIDFFGLRNLRKNALKPVHKKVSNTCVTRGLQSRLAPGQLLRPEITGTILIISR
jgi:hypothetical protein